MDRREELLNGAKQLRDIVKKRSARSVVVFSGCASFVISGGEFLALEALTEINWSRFVLNAPNPTPVEVDAAVTWVCERDADLIIAIGGGSVVDLAKLAGFLATNGKTLAKWLDNDALGSVPSIPVVAIPTTSGTGAEVTPFATVWINGRKASVDRDELVPAEYLHLLPLFQSQPPYLIKCTAMDALAQGIESYWSVLSTSESRALASNAIRVLWPAIREIGDGLPADFARLSRGALLAGAAIAISRTTACHAISYPITGRFGVPHGHAVALTLPAALEFVGGCGTGDARGTLTATDVSERAANIAAMLGASSAHDGRRVLERLLDDLGLERRLSELGCGSPASVNQILDEGFNPSRMGNFPRYMSRFAMASILGQLG